MSPDDIDMRLMLADPLTNPLAVGVLKTIFQIWVCIIVMNMLRCGSKGSHYMFCCIFYCKTLVNFPSNLRIHNVILV